MFIRYDYFQWRIQVRGPGCPASPLYLDQQTFRSKWRPKSRQKFFGRLPSHTPPLPPPPPLLLSKCLDDRPPLCQGLDPALISESPDVHRMKVKRTIALLWSVPFSEGCKENWAILVYGNHVFPLNCPLCARSVSFVYCRRSLHLCDRHPFGCL